jgi:hypothetical protein
LEVHLKGYFRELDYQPVVAQREVEGLLGRAFKAIKEVKVMVLDFGGWDGVNCDTFQKLLAFLGN